MEFHLSQDLKNGGVVYINLMSILMLGVKSVLEQRESQLYGPVLEEAVSLSFQIFIHAFLKESLFVEARYPSHQARVFNTLSSGDYVAF
jgi:nuclear pore complex protein Nup205